MSKAPTMNIRIVLLVKHFYPDVGGGANYFYELCKRLIDRGIKVTVIAEGKSYKIESAVVRNSIIVFRLPSLKLPLLDQIRHSLSELHYVEHMRDKVMSTFTSGVDAKLFVIRGLIHEPQYAQIAIPYLIANSGSYDLIHAAAVIFSCPYIGYIVGKMLNKPVVLTAFLHTETKSFTRPHMLEICKRVDAVLVETPFEKKYLINAGCPRDKIFVVGIGVDYKRYLHVSKKLVATIRDKLGLRNSKVILWLGRRAYTKGFLHTIIAFAKVARELRDVKLAIVGPPTEELPEHLYRPVLQHLKEKGLVIDLGIVPEHVKLALLHIADVVCLPSISETIPLTALEAWACKKPIILADIPTVKSVIKHEGNGALLCRFGDTSELAEKLSLLLQDDALREEVGQRGFQMVVKDLNWERVAERTIEAYEYVLTGRR